MRQVWERRLVEGGLIVCIYWAVLAFGGKESPFFDGVQIIAFLLGGFVLWGRGIEKATFHLFWKGPSLLLGYVLFYSLARGPHLYVTQEHVLRLIAYLCIFYVTLLVAQDEDSRHRLVIALIALGLFEALYGLVQYLSGWQQIFAYKKVFYVENATGTYINPNHYAGLLEMVLPLVFARTLYLLEGMGRKTGTGQAVIGRLFGGDRIARPLFFSFVTVVIFAGILFSRSRMGIFCAAAAIVAVGLLWASLAWRRPVAFLVLIVFLVGTALFGIWIGLGPVAERYETVSRDYLLRLGIWKDSVALIKAHPLFGTGLGTFADVYPQFQTVFLAQFVDHAHNDYLELASELGLLGASLLFGLILIVWGKGLSVFHRVAQNRERFLALGSCGSILAILLHSLADFNLEIPANAFVFSVILALAHSSSLNTRPRNKEAFLPDTYTGTSQRLCC